MIEALAYVLVVLLGVIMGLMGAGGAIMIVPILVYLLGHSVQSATGISLFVIGATSLLGAVLAQRNGEVRLQAAILFALTSIPTSFLARKVVLPLIPDPIGGVPRSSALMLLFAALMLAAAIAMLRSSETTQRNSAHPAALILVGAGVGLVTGVLGAGGGFIIVPALVILGGLPMKQAVGTSLALIALNSAAGFWAEVATGPVQWELLLGLSALALSGMFVGSRMRQKVAARRLRTAFGSFVLVIGLIVAGTEALRLL